MANVDVTLRLTNPALYNQLQALVNNPHTVNLTLAMNPTNLANITSLIRTQVQNIPVTIQPTLRNANQLQAQIRAAIGNVPINVSIANLAALNQQIAQIFANAGINVGNYNNPPRNNRGGQAAARGLGSILASQIRNEENPVDPRLVNIERTLGVLSGQAGVPGIKAEESLRKINRARDTITRRRAKYQSEFEQKRLLEIALLGPDAAAREFEQQKGIRGGSINTQGINRLSFNIARPFQDRAARNELGFAALFGGIPGAVGGLAGGAAFGAGGVFLGSALFQKSLEFVSTSFEGIAEVLKKAAEAGIEFQQNIANVATTLTLTSKVVDKSGKEVDVGRAFAFQTQRSRGLVEKATNELAPFGVGSENVTNVINGIVAGAAKNGINYSDAQLSKLTKSMAIALKIFAPQLPAGKIANDVQDFYEGQTNNEISRSPIGSVLGPKIRAAVQKGDPQAIVDAWGKLDKILNELSGSSQNASQALGKVNAVFGNLQRNFGDAFDKALIPGLDAFAKAISNPKLQAAMTSLGRDLGTLVNWIVEIAAKIAGFLAAHPEIAKGAVRAAGGAAAGAGIGAGIGFLTGNLPGALAGLGIGAAVGGATGLIASLGGVSKEDIANAQRGTSNGTDTGDLKAVALNDPRSVSANITKRIASSVDTGTISGKYTQEQADLIAKSQLAGGNLDNSLVVGRNKDNLLNARTDQTLAFYGAIKSNLERYQLAAENEPGTRLGFYEGRVKFNRATNRISTVRDPLTGGRVASTTGLRGSEEYVGETQRFAVQIKTLPPALEAFQLAVLAANDALNDFTNDREIDKLQGAEKLAALNKQIIAAGGSPQFSQARGYSQFETEGDANSRKLELLKAQFKQESDKLDPFRFDEETRRQQLQKEKALREANNNVENFDVNSKLASVQKDKETLDFLKKFSPDELKEIDFTDAQGKSVKGNELKETIEKKLESQFGKALGSTDLDKKLSDRLGGNGIPDISKDLKALIDSLVDKIKEGVTAANKETFN